LYPKALMKDRSFLDTNIFVYSFDPNALSKSRRAIQLIQQALSTGKGIISYQVVQEFFNVAFRRFSQPMTPEEAGEYLKAVLVPMLGVHSSQALYYAALNLRADHRLSWYDSLIVAAATQTQCKVLLTEDLQHGRRFGDLRVENPFL
jgi:predicted nucleic acid-binding protein